MPTATTATGHLALPPRVICAWCDRSMGVTASRGRQGRGSTSHGLCTDCIEQLLDSLLVAPAPQTPRRRTPQRRVLRDITPH